VLNERGQLTLPINHQFIANYPLINLKKIKNSNYQKKILSPKNRKVQNSKIQNPKIKKIPKKYLKSGNPKIKNLNLIRSIIYVFLFSVIKGLISG